ncbi:putative 6-phosphogluconolactonase [Obelidium mucronatum]|nr:putative 6-phosphogluconolactonase [Obelidium mucronatum]
MTAPIIKVSASAAEISTQLSVDVSRLSEERIAQSGRFVVAVSGGSLPSILSKELKNNSSVDWSKWHVFLADERCVPNTHADSNMFLLQKELLNAVPIPASQVHPINDSLLTSENGTCSDAETAAVAVDYKKQLESLFGSNIEFDLILLGMGPDGHTCSLFPGHLLLNVTSTSVAYLIDSPKPPPARITLTYPVLNAARHVFFVSTGEGKAEVLHDILVKGVVYPSGLVKPKSPVVWYLDKPAAKLLGSIASL